MLELVSNQEIRSLSESFKKGQDLLKALFHILSLKQWKGGAEQLAESLPHFNQSFNLKDLKTTLNDIGFKLNTFELNNKTLDKRLLPVIYINQNNIATVIDYEDDNFIEITEFGERRPMDWPHYFTGTICILEEKPKNIGSKGWFKQVFLNSKLEFLLLVGLGCVSNISLLMTPLYVMFVYDKVLRARSVEMLIAFLVGIILILSWYWFIQKARRRIVADLCANSVKNVDNNILAKLLKLPSNYTEVSSISSQITRVQDYEDINETFAKNILSSMIDIPFYVLFLVIFYFIGGAIVIVPMVGMLLYGVLVLSRSVWDKYFASNELIVDTSWRSFLIESVQKLYAIRSAHFEKAWIKRFSQRTATMVFDKFKESFRASVYEIIGEAVMLLIVLSLLGVGAMLISAQQLSVGGLIAGMILIWQIMNPVKQLTSRSKQFSNFKKTLTQLDKIDRIAEEDFGHIGEKPAIKGAIEFNQVGIRYMMDREPALIGISFKLAPGEMLALTGKNGAGKSTILKLIMRLYQQQVGAITIDEQDIRQIPHNLLRKCIAYAPQNPQFFYGTIQQNLKLANPLASSIEISEACRKAGVLNDIRQLPNGFETRLRDNEMDQLPASFRKRLQLARTLLVKAPILLLDEPASHLDGEHDKNFIELLKQLKGTKTIVMVSHRPSHIAIADYVLNIERGQIKSLDKQKA